MTAPLRVLHVHSGNMFGGVETVLTTLVRLRDACPEMESTFALCFEGRLSDELRAAGAIVHPLGAVRFRWPWTVWQARRRLQTLLRRDRFDVALFHSCWSHALFAGPVRRAGIPLVHWIHGAATPSHWQARLARRTPPDLVLANSRFIAEQSAGLFPHVPIEVQYPFCEMPRITDRDSTRREVRTELQTPDDAVVILTACRMERGKGHPVVIEALKNLANLANWRWWIAGGASREDERRYQDELRQAVEVVGISDRVRFLGPRTDVPRLLRAADILCQANTHPEGFGLAFVEAMYAGLPVVTTAIGGALEILDDSCGVLIELGDQDSLADQLRWLLLEQPHRERLGRAGASRAVALFAPDKQIQSLQSRLSRIDLGDVVTHSGNVGAKVSVN